jgi:hypothetical protein
VSDTILYLKLTHISLQAGEDGLRFGLHRWFLVGGQNSGSNMHVDPLGTSAWNTLLLGRKLWVLFPPGTREGDLKTGTLSPGRKGRGGGEGCGGGGGGGSCCGVSESDNESDDGSESGSSQQADDFCAAGWFANMLPHLPAHVCAQKRLFIQKAGETVFVPAGWFHAVLNLSTTVCVTQNYASPHDYLRVVRALYNGGGGGAEREEADEWRVRVQDNYMWNEILSSGNSSSKQSLAVDFCVHCSQKTHGHVCELLDSRPVCATCEASDLYGDEYVLISAAASWSLGWM